MNTAHLFQGWGGWLLAEVEESGGKEVGAIRVFIYLFMFFFLNSDLLSRLKPRDMPQRERKYKRGTVLPVLYGCRRTDVSG